MASLEQWRKLVAPAKCEGDVWFVGEGPALRFVPSNDMQPLSIVLRVESLEGAETVLRRKKLACEVRPGQLELRVAGTLGLRIILIE